MRTVLVKTRTIARDVEKEHLLMAGAYGSAGYFGHGSELLLALAYFLVFMLHVHLIYRRRVIRHAEQQDHTA